MVYWYQSDPANILKTYVSLPQTIYINIVFFGMSFAKSWKILSFDFDGALKIRKTPWQRNIK